MRRRRIYPMTWDGLRLLMWPDGSTRAVEPLPEDARIVVVVSREECGTIDVHVESESFEDVPPGATFPTYHVSYREGWA